MDTLLKLLHENAALKPAQLAAMLQSTEAEVAAKIKAYEADEVILGYRTILNEEKLGVDLLSDFKREVSRQYGTLLEQHFFSNRAYVLIDKTGMVRWTFAEETPGTKRDNSELLAQLKAIA